LLAGSIKYHDCITIPNLQHYPLEFYNENSQWITAKRRNEMISPLVSIVLPVWNPKPEWINAAVESAFHESCCRIELVLVDDGSDEPPHVWLSPENLERTRVIRIPHMGVNHAQNVGIEHCRGDFIRFLGGDDVFLPDSTSDLIKVIGNDHSAVAYGSTILCDTNLNPYKTIRTRLNGRIHLQTALGRFESTIPALLIPHKVAKQIGGFDERFIVMGDWDFVLRLTEVAEFRGTQNPVYLYRRHEKSLTGRGDKRHEAIKSTIYTIRGYLNRHPELINTRSERLVRAHAQFLIAKFWNSGNLLRSTRFWKAATIDPARGTAIALTRIAAMCARALIPIARSLKNWVTKNHLVRLDAR
jgi:glycosyltransferase involved in cell wall biosynthesis